MKNERFALECVCYVPPKVEQMEQSGTAICSFISFVNRMPNVIMPGVGAGGNQVFLAGSYFLFAQCDGGWLASV